ncbi:hypothetical protein OIE13_31650 [Streptosporangium sp. NBC_01810]|uniref:hypothetical protein n=1 Tax=Streptosporangium sp. NBC_01810 TaxID=2975951 RepID=UPI002DD95CAE|nr:hypothetical protein [Streptosporangium sp. NBC_01810]WSA25427.1 hypothetical protein OIE13_31650 [Streptosporangium sp. NBC_01810]
MTRKALVAMTVLACAMAISTACQSDEVAVDRTPLPTVAAPPYLCDHIPLKAVELMTGVRNPLVRGYFDFTISGGLGAGGCAVYQREGERLKVLQVDLTPGGDKGDVEEMLGDGATPLPEILPGVTGYYFRRASGEDNAAFSTLVRGKAEINIQLEIGAEGRDNAADVLALMKLIAPKLLTDASAPSAKTETSPTPKD